jgi:hypothetical protein
MLAATATAMAAATYRHRLLWASLSTAAAFDRHHFQPPISTAADFYGNRYDCRDRDRYDRHFTRRRNSFNH